MVKTEIPVDEPEKLLGVMPSETAFAIVSTRLKEEREKLKKVLATNEKLRFKLQNATKENYIWREYARWTITQLSQSQQIMLDVIREYVDKAKQKDPSERKAIKNMLMDMAFTCKNFFKLPDDLMQEIASLDNMNQGLNHFPPCLNYEQGSAILQKLKEGGFVAKDTEPMNFLYQMGCTGESPQNISPVVWLKTKQLLREMLELWFRKLIDEGTMTKAKVEEICPQIFMDKNGEMIHLANNKRVLSNDSDDLSTYFATL